MAEAVELGPDLADLGDDELVMVHEPVFAEWAAGRTTRIRIVKARFPNRGMVEFVVVSHPVDLAILDPLGGVEHLLGSDVVEAPA